MAARALSASSYVIVLVVLLVLTVLTVAMSFVHLEGSWHVGIGLAIGACKASLVILFFMHALVRSRVTWAVIVVSAFWLGLLLTLTMSDYVTRDLIPLMPGH